MVIDPLHLPGIVLKQIDHDGQFLSRNLNISFPSAVRIFRGASPDAAGEEEYENEFSCSCDHGFQNARRGWLRL